jgi:hypothetical protein
MLHLFDQCTMHKPSAQHHSTNGSVLEKSFILAAIAPTAGCLMERHYDSTAGCLVEHDYRFYIRMFGGA